MAILNLLGVDKFNEILGDVGEETTFPGLLKPEGWKRSSWNQEEVNEVLAKLGLS